MSVDCPKNLACSLTGNGKPNTCLNLKGQKSLSNKYCANNLISQNSTCTCQVSFYCLIHYSYTLQIILSNLYYLYQKSGKFYNSKTVTCVPKMTYGTTCSSSSQCLNGLICSSIGKQKNLCLKDKNSKCTSSNECTNNIPCRSGICQCKPLVIFYFFILIIFLNKINFFLNE